MAAIALPVALILGLLAELVSGLVSWPLGGEKKWWRGVSGIGSDAARLVRDRTGIQRVSVVEAGGAAAGLLGAGLVAGGALDIGPSGLVLLYLFLALAFGGTAVVGGGQGARRSRLAPALAELALAAGLGTMFLRYGALDLDAVRGTQQILGTGLILGPEMTVVGMVAAAMAFAWAVALNVPKPAAVEGRQAAGAGERILLRLCRWALVGASALLAGVLLAGGGIDPIERAQPLAAAGAGFAVSLGIADAILGRLSARWLSAVTFIVLALGAGGAALVVLS